MENNDNPSSKKSIKEILKNTKVTLPTQPRVALPLVFLFLAIWVLLPRQAKFAYDYRKGSTWDYENLVAQFEFPILKTQEELAQEKSKYDNQTIPYFRYAEDVVNNNLKGVENLQLGSYTNLKPALYSALNDIYDKGVVTDDGIKNTKGTGDLSNEIIYIQKDKRATKYPASEVYKITDARERLLRLMTKGNESINVDSLLRRSGAYDLIVPNLVFDKQTTALVHSESSNQTSPTLGVVNAGQLIVSNGEIVTGEIVQLLDSYKAEFEQNMGYSGPPFLFWFGNAILALVLVIMFALVIFFTNPLIFQKSNKFYYISTIFLIATVSAIAASKLDSELVFIVPFTLTTLYLQAFFTNKVIVPISIISLIPLLIFAKNGVVLYVMFVLGSLASLIFFKYFEQSWKQFAKAFIVFAILVVVYFGFRLVDMVGGNPYTVVLCLFAGATLSVFGYPLIFLFEKIFNLVSQSRLRDMANVEANAFLQKFENIAPGTFQHANAVKEMVDRVARNVDANVNLLRAAALYHDIGKMNNPTCFIENERLLNGRQYHAQLTPEESAKQIIAHVTDGLAIAEEIKLPNEIKEFIITHHGTTRTGYFYSKYVNQGGDPNNTAPFTYPGRSPLTKEEAILMICDTVEAASRNLEDHSSDSHAAFVAKMIQGKYMEGQFNNCEISISDIKKVEKSLIDYLNENFHERIAYPHIKG